MVLVSDQYQGDLSLSNPGYKIMSEKDRFVSLKLRPNMLFPFNKTLLHAYGTVTITTETKTTTTTTGMTTPSTVTTTSHSSNSTRSR